MFYFLGDVNSRRFEVDEWNKMNRSRSKSIENLVITKADLIHLWKFLEDVARTDSNGSAGSRPKITVVSDGNVTSESDSSEIFDNDVLDIRKSLQIDFRYSNYRTAKSIQIALREGAGHYYGSSFSVSGDSLIWVDATFVGLDTIFNAIKPQLTFVRRFKWPIRLSLFASAGYSMVRIWFLIVPPSKSAEPDPAWVKFVFAHPPLGTVVALVFCAMIGAFPGDFLFDKLNALWPSIEFDFGPEHLKLKKRLRTNLGFVTVAFLFPVLLEIISRLFK